MKIAPIVVALFSFSLSVSSLAADPKPATPSASTGATKIDPEREKKELRLVELLKQSLKQPPPPEADRKKLMDEYMSLLAYFGGFDPKSPPKDREQAMKQQQAAMNAQAEILQRRDPALAAQMLKETKTFACKSKQTEAKANLRGLFTAEKAYQGEHDAFSKDMKALDAPLESKRYAITVSAANATKFTARATGQAEMAGDVWEVDETGMPKAVTDLCAK